MAYRNYFDTTGKNSQDGQSAENAFEKILKDKGYETRKSSFGENVHKHIDLYAKKDGIETSYDIKSRKRVNRADINPNDELIWLEVLNTQGKKGWISSEANYITFEREHDFILVTPENLQKLIKEKCNLNNKVNSGKDALYSSYTRSGRADVLTIVKISDILAIMSEKILK
jgi:hypothetical protein